MYEGNVKTIGDRALRARATRAVARQLVVAEAQLDRAGIELMKVGISLLEARAATNLSATYADDTVGIAVEAIAEWGGTRSKVVQNHKRLLIVATQLGTQQIAFGEGGGRPSDDASIPMTGLADFGAAVA